MSYKNPEDEKIKKHEYYLKNREKILERQKKYQKEHRKDKNKYLREYRSRPDCKERRHQQYIDNKEKFLRQSRDYYERTKNELVLYQVWIERIHLFYNDDEVRRDPNNLNFLQLRCKYCGKWMNPTNNEIEYRWKAIRTICGENNIYCSDACKRACPTFNQNKYPKGFKPSTSREVQPELRKMVLKRDNWTCQKCGQSKEENPELELHCHHIDPVVNNPVESADADNCITLCKECHKFVHSELPGCKLGDLSKCGRNK